MNTRARRFARLIGSVLSACAAICLLAAPAHAAIDADFNGDGVLDPVVPHPTETSIVVRLSGAAPQVLKLHDQIIAIVAADVDHDGDLDLSALSKRRGVFIWLNKGKAEKTHFKALKRKHTRRAFSLTTRGPLASAPEGAADGPASLSTQDDRDRTAHLEHTTGDPSLHRTAHHVARHDPALPDHRGSASPSRAPPFTLA